MEGAPRADAWGLAADLLDEADARGWVVCAEAGDDKLRARDETLGFEVLGEGERTSWHGEGDGATWAVVYRPGSLPGPRPRPGRRRPRSGRAGPTSSS